MYLRAVKCTKLLPEAFYTMCWLHSQKAVQQMYDVASIAFHTCRALSVQLQ